MKNNPRHNILLIDDHPTNLMVASALLDQLGYNYLVASSGQEAIEIFRKASFDVILMDIQMPVISGVDTARQIRLIEGEEQMPCTPIVAVTAHIANADMNTWIDAGIEDVIPKPLHPDYFSKILKKYCLPREKAEAQP